LTTQKFEEEFFDFGQKVDFLEVDFLADINNFIWTFAYD